MEIWKPIEGYEGLYEVSSYGNVRSLDREVNQSNGSIGHYRGKQLKGEYDNKGYKRFRLSKNNKSRKIFAHRLVANAFIPNPFNKPFVNHIDETHDNNKVENLEWCTYVENMNHGTIRKRLSNIKKKKIKCITDGRKFESVNEASLFYNIPRRSISNVLTGARKRVYGLQFKYDNEEAI